MYYHRSLDEVTEHLYICTKTSFYLLKVILGQLCMCLAFVFCIWFNMCDGNLTVTKNSILQKAMKSCKYDMLQKFYEN